jgi:hypothetical protein
MVSTPEIYGRTGKKEMLINYGSLSVSLGVFYVRGDLVVAAADGE